MNNNLLKKQYIDFLGSPEFLTTIKQYNLPDILFNELFTAHCIAIGGQATGIKDGGVTLSYVTSDAPGYEENIPGPKLQYHFYTTRNALIQPGLHCSNNSLSIKNIHNYPFKHSRGLRNFLDDYWINMRHLPQSSLKDLEGYTFSISFAKSYNQQKKHEYLYDCIIGNNFTIKSFLNWHYLQSQLIKKPSIPLKKNKI